VLALRQRNIIPRLPRRGTRDGVEEDSHLGAIRWTVERTFACLNQMRRLRVRHKRCADPHQAFLTFGRAIVYFRTLNPLFC
jgi:hypothetical protein